MVGWFFPEVQKWSGMVEMPSRRVGSGREALMEGKALVRRFTQRAWSDREWSGGLSGGPGVVGRPSRRVMSGRKVFPEGRK